jgi:hypothetical protein
MVYVARFSPNIESDIKRGWSGYMGSHGVTAEEALESIGVYLDDMDLEAAQARWVRTYGSQNEDYDFWYGEFTRDLAESKGLRFDDDLGEWRAFHHDGLSCWALEATDDAAAMGEAADAGIEWAGWGQSTIGSIRVVGKVMGTGDPAKDEFLWVLECDDYCGEV